MQTLAELSESAHHAKPSLEEEDQKNRSNKMIKPNEDDEPSEVVMAEAGDVVEEGGSPTIVGASVKPSYREIVMGMEAKPLQASLMMAKEPVVTVENPPVSVNGEMKVEGNQVTENQGERNPEAQVSNKETPLLVSQPVPKESDSSLRAVGNTEKEAEIIRMVSMKQSAAWNEFQARKMVEEEILNQHIHHKLEEEVSFAYNLLRRVPNFPKKPPDLNQGLNQGGVLACDIPRERESSSMQSEGPSSHNDA
ncbi:hypothetical protein RIF29_16310 [Crotalaria pallida]|uniref:Uncharacterized protein n=1 Tax=Crotalaria pallida TaxID=3830 RepID=A0AAN9IJQ6_CROPI